MFRVRVRVRGWVTFFMPSSDIVKSKKVALGFARITSMRLTGGRLHRSEALTICRLLIAFGLLLSRL